MIQIFDCDQGSPEWFQCRLGIPTASEFSTVMAKGEGKTRKTYMLKLAGERMLGVPAESYTNGHMERGKEMEDEARDFYCFERNVDVHRVGFVRNGQMGASPDSLIGDNAGLEIKTALPHIQIDRLLRNELPAEHKAQVQGAMLVCDRDSWDFVSYWPKLPLLVVSVRRDNGYIANLKGEIDRFNEELEAMVERLSHYGEPKPEIANILAAG